MQFQYRIFFLSKIKRVKNKNTNNKNKINRISIILKNNSKGLSIVKYPCQYLAYSTEVVTFPLTNSPNSITESYHSSGELPDENDLSSPFVSGTSCVVSPFL